MTNASTVTYQMSPVHKHPIVSMKVNWFMATRLGHCQTSSHQDPTRQNSSHVRRSCGEWVSLTALLSKCVLCSSREGVGGGEGSVWGGGNYTVHPIIRKRKRGELVYVYESEKLASCESVTIVGGESIGPSFLVKVSIRGFSCCFCCLLLVLLLSDTSLYLYNPDNWCMPSSSIIAADAVVSVSASKAFMTP